MICRRESGTFVVAFDSIIQQAAKYQGDSGPHNPRKEAKKHCTTRARPREERKYQYNLALQRNDKLPTFNKGW